MTATTFDDRGPTSVRTAQPVRLDLATTFLIGVIFVASTVDLPLQVKIGGSSMLAVFTVLAAVMAWGIFLLRPSATRQVWKVAVPALLLLMWMPIPGIWGRFTTSGMQFMTVMLGFVGLLLLSARTALHRRSFFASLGFWIGVLVMISLYLFAARMLREEWGIVLPVSLDSARLMPLFLLIPISYFLSLWQSGKPFGLVVAVVLVGVILFDLSRMALVTAFVLFVLALIRPGRLLPWKRILLWGVPTVVSLYLLVMYYEPLYTRFFSKDTSLVIGDVAINASGRTVVWTNMLNWMSDTGNWIFGRGPGGASRFAAWLTQGVLDHPHNEYLRMIYDFGIFGLGMWLIFMVMLGVTIWRSWRRAIDAGRSTAVLHQTALLSLIGCLITMSTDNTMAYSFVMYPLAIVVGASIGASDAPGVGKPAADGPAA
jgi:O-antigen ligase